MVHKFRSETKYPDDRYQFTTKSENTVNRNILWQIKATAHKIEIYTRTQCIFSSSYINSAAIVSDLALTCETRSTEL